MSDSHGDVFSLRRAVENQRSASLIVFLGDGEYDWDAVRSSCGARRATAVRGNCDFGSALAVESLETLGGKRIFCCHGHTLGVKFGDDRLVAAAREAGADIALFGHTHTPFSDYRDGLWLFNPGSVREGSCGFIDITDAGTVCGHLKIN